MAPTVRVPTDRPAPTVTSKAGSQWVLRTNQHTNDDEMYERPVHEPAPSVTTRGDNWKLTQKATGQKGSRSRSRDASEPSLPVALGHNAAAWCWERPSTAVMGTPRLAPPGYRNAPDDPSMFDGESVRVELHELATLQDYPAGYPFKGNKTEQARQIGNSVPSTLAEVIVRELTK